MTQIKKLGFGTIAASLAMFVAMSVIVSTAYAAVTTTPANATANISTNLATGVPAFTNTSAFVITEAAAGEIGTGTITLQAPVGWRFNPGGTAPDVAVTGTALAANDPAVVSADGSTITVTVTAVSTAAGTLTVGGTNPIQVQPLFANTASGSITRGGTATVNGLASGATVGTLTATARTAPYTFGGVTFNPTSTVAADGSQVISVAVASLDDAANVDVRNTPITVTSALGYVAATQGAAVTSTSKTATVTTDNTNGGFTVWYRGGGTAGTDTLIFSAPHPSGSQISTANVTLQTVSPTAGTATQLTSVSATPAVIAPDNTAATGGAYTSPNSSSTVRFRLTDANGVGVNGASVLVSTSGGRIAATANACATGGTSTVVQTATQGTTTGIAQVVVCATAASHVGTFTVTAQSVVNNALTATREVTSAGPAANVTSSWNNGQLTVNVTDADGRPVANGTGVRVTMANAVGTAAPEVATTTNGTATFAVALNQATGNAIISVADGAGGTPIALTGVTRVNRSINVTQTTTPAPGTGDGSLTAPNFGSGNVGSAVFGGGSIEELADAAADAGGTAVWVQGSNGNWYRYSIGATGATAFVNNAFNTQFAAGFAGATPVFVVK